MAWTGKFDAASIKPCIKALWCTEADTVNDIYPHPEQTLRPGLIFMTRQLDSGMNNYDNETTRYLVLVMQLQKKLIRNNAMSTKLQQALNGLQAHQAQHELSDEQIYPRLADVYQQTISQLRPRIMVNGDYSYLSNNDNANRIRVMLLAAIRAAVLWSQCGGTRVNLVLQRRELLKTAEQMV